MQTKILLKKTVIFSWKKLVTNKQCFALFAFFFYPKLELIKVIDTLSSLAAWYDLELDDMIIMFFLLNIIIIFANFPSLPLGTFKLKSSKSGGFLGLYPNEMESTLMANCGSPYWSHLCWWCVLVAKAISVLFIIVRRTGWKLSSKLGF